MQKDMVQLPNPRTKRWMKINTATAKIISHKKSLGAYANVRIVDAVKCDCTHPKSDHYLTEGYCSKCACTWFHPEIKYCKPLKR